VRIGVLGSTRGTALQGVIDEINSGCLKDCAKIELVISNKKEGGILARASKHSIPAKYMPFKKGSDKALYDAEITSAFNSVGCDLILCVGWMRILTPGFTNFWAGRVMNVHPSLLPLHAGGMDLEVHAAVLAAGEKTSGCTIHQVTDVVDGGPIVLQKKVDVVAGETAGERAFERKCNRRVRGD